MVVWVYVTMPFVSTGVGLTGFPNAGNTGVQSGTSLTPSSALELVSPTHDGLTFQNLDISTTDTSEAVGIAAIGVTIKNCKIHATGGAGNSPGWVMAISSQSSSIQIINCEIYGSSANTQAGPCVNMQGGGNITFKACNIHSMVHGIDMAGNTGTTLIQDCYVNNLTSASADPHYDCLYYGGNYTAAFNLQHNTLENTNPQTAGLFMENFFGSVSNFTINNNLFNTRDPSTTGTLQGWELRTDKSASVCTNIAYTNNAMVAPGDAGDYFLVVGSSAITTFSGNYDFNTKQSLLTSTY